MAEGDITPTEYEEVTKPPSEIPWPETRGKEVDEEVPGIPVSVASDDTVPQIPQVPLELTPVVRQPRVYRKELLKNFQVNQLVSMGGAVFAVRKVTLKDLVLRPVGILPQREDNVKPEATLEGK